MFQRESARQLVKQVLLWSRVKLIYTRITLTKFTTFYFFLALFGCIVQVALQGLAFSDNSEAASIISGLLVTGNVTRGLAMVRNGQLIFCNDIPAQSDSNCLPILPSNTTLAGREAIPLPRFVRDAHSSALFPRAIDPKAHVNASGLIDGVKVDTATLDTPCLQSLLWLADLLADAKREDIVTLAFQIWLFSLAIVTILNESLPHLGAALLAHILGTGWTAFRVSESRKWQNLYMRLVVQGTCNNVDLLGPWWDVRTEHTYPSLILNAVALLLACYISLKLFKVYSAQSFTRVGASPQIHQLYKLVLLLSVLLQLAGFFTLGATGMWIDKISSGNIRYLAQHFIVYLAAFVVVAVVELPWVILGWLSVRRESRWMFLAFCGLSVLLFVVSTLLFFSSLYRFIFSCWPFFATMSVTAYIVIVATSIMGVLCRLNFGKGLAHYLQVTEALEDVDFTPVYFSKDSYESTRSISKSDLDPEKTLDETPRDIQISSLPYAQYRKHAVSVYSDPQRETVKLSTTPPLARDDSPFAEAASGQTLALPDATAKRHKLTAAKSTNRSQVVSVYSDNTRQTVKISSTPDLVRGESPLTRVDSTSTRFSLSPNGTFRTSSLRRDQNNAGTVSTAAGTMALTQKGSRVLRTKRSWIQSPTASSTNTLVSTTQGSPTKPPGNYF